MKILTAKAILCFVALLIVGLSSYKLLSRDKATSPQELHEQAYSLMQEKDYPGALEKARAAIRISPDYIEGWVDQGIALYSMGECAEGAASLYHASMLSPSNETVNEILGSMLSKCKEEESKTENKSK